MQGKEGIQDRTKFRSVCIFWSRKKAASHCLHTKHSPEGLKSSLLQQWGSREDRHTFADELRLHVTLLSWFQRCNDGTYCGADQVRVTTESQSFCEVQEATSNCKEITMLASQGQATSGFSSTDAPSGCRAQLIHTHLLCSTIILLLL